MKRPWHAWTIYGMCVVILVAVMGWITATVKRLENENEAAEQMASLEETVRLALWRMDAAISPLIIEESARPYVDYAAFKPAYAVYPASQDDQEITPLVPSPLLTQSSSNVFAYFNCLPPGTGGAPQITSPGVPDGEQLNLALANFDLAPLFMDNRRRINEFKARVDGDALRKACDIAASRKEDAGVIAPEPRRVSKPETRSGKKKGQQGEEIERNAYVQNVNEWSARNVAQMKAKSKVKVTKQSAYDSYKSHSKKTRPRQKSSQPLLQDPYTAKVISEDIMRSLWVDDVLVLARKVTVDGDSCIQGLWLNWESIQEELLGEIRDLLPEAELVPVRHLGAGTPARMMAALPVQIQPGAGRLSALRLPRLL